MDVLEKIAAIQTRIYGGFGLMRIPVDETDVDLVMHACEKEIIRLRAENEALKANAVLLYNLGYHAGHHNTVESQYTDIVVADMQTFHSDVVAEIVAALAAKGAE